MSDPAPASAGFVEVEIRPAEPGDAQAINAIYNHYVVQSTCTWQYEPTPIQQRRQWLAEHDRPEHPVIVAHARGEVVGWGALSAYHAKPGYRYTVENSVYIAPQWQRKGLGRRLMEQLIALACQAQVRSIVAVISGDQAASIALHQRMGFVEVGRIPQCGRKFDRWLDVVYMQRLLAGGPR